MKTTRKDFLKALGAAGAALGAIPVIGKSNIGLDKDENEDYCRLCEILIDQSAMLIKKSKGRFHPFVDMFFIEVPRHFLDKIKETRYMRGIYKNPCSVFEFLNEAWPKSIWKTADSVQKGLMYTYMYGLSDHVIETHQIRFNVF